MIEINKMDIRSLCYFLVIAREGSFTKAAEVLHMTQPPLSRQIRELENDLGVELFDRSGKRIALTDEGLVLRERAQEVIDLMEKIRDEVALDAEGIAGEVRIACGESDAVSLFASAAKRLQGLHPNIHYRLLSGDGDFVDEQLQRGAADIGLLVTDTVDGEKYDYARLPLNDRWGILIKRDDALAKKRAVKLGDIADAPLILPYRAALSSDLMSWFEQRKTALNIVATYDLAYNASRFAKEGFGYAVALDGIVETGERSELIFRPLSPTLTASLFVVWRKGIRLSRAASMFLNELNCT